MSETAFDPNEEERGNVQRLLRWVGAFLAWPGLTIALVFLVDLQGHEGHFLISLTAGVAGVVVWFLAPKLALRAHPVA